MSKIRVGIVGISGNGGGELVRYLLGHPEFVLTNAYGEGSVGKKLSQLFPGLPEMFGNISVGNWNSNVSSQDVDLLFLSLPTGKSREIASQIPENIRIVDLGGDHRFVPDWTYSIPEVSRKILKNVKRVANPGCYPTAILLALAPFAGEDSILCGERIIINANSGLSGLGRGSKESAVFSDLNEDAWTYKVFGHPHIPEIKSAIETDLNAKSPQIIFIPQCVPMTRGISAVCVLKGKTADYNEKARLFYKDRPFVRVSDQSPHTKWTSGTNLAYVSYASSAEENTVIAMSVIDNLGKGAAGQAIQNANLMFDLPETTGLVTVPVWP